MHIEELHLQNFRGFQELKFKLPHIVWYLSKRLVSSKQSAISHQ
jgi:AAA15 family ATPase/GTPase